MLFQVVESKFRNFQKGFVKLSLYNSLIGLMCFPE